MHWCSMNQEAQCLAGTVKVEDASTPVEVLDEWMTRFWRPTKKWIVNLDFTDFTFFDSDSWISRLFKGIVPFCRVYERTVYTILYLRIPFCVTVHHDLPFAKDIAAKGSFKVSAGPFESNDHRGYFPPGDLWCQVSKRSLDSEAAGIFFGCICWSMIGIFL